MAHSKVIAEGYLTVSHHITRVNIKLD